MRFRYVEILALSLLFVCAGAHAECPDGSADPKCPSNAARARQQEKQDAQRRAQQEAQQRAQKEAQERAQQQAQKREQQQAQERERQEMRQRAQQETQERAKREAQERAQQQAQKRAQHQAQESARQETQQRAQQQVLEERAQRRTQQEAQERARQQAQEQVRKQADEQVRKQTAPNVSATSPSKARQPQQAPAGAAPQPAQHSTSTIDTPQMQQRQPVVLNATTSLVPQAGRAGFDIARRNPDGSQLVVTQRRLPDGAPQVVGYKQIDEPASDTMTRIYFDGNRVTRGREFDSRSLYGGPTYFNYRSGLQAAVLPNGKPIFREGFTVRPGPDGREQWVIERIEYAQMVRGSPVFISRPIVRVYDVVTVYGMPVHRYRTSHFTPVVYRHFWAPFAAPLAVTPTCAICPAPLVVFPSPVTSYSDPVDLMGDLQISTAFEYGAAYRPPSGATRDRDGFELAELRNQVADLRQQVSANAQINEALRAQLPDAGARPANRQDSTDAGKIMEGGGGIAPVQVSEDVRQQIRKQVRLNIAQHQNGHSLVLSDIIASGYAKIYIFQAAGLLDVNEVESAGVCFLSAGDLLGFATVPNGSSPVAEMKIISSGANSCRPKQVVQVRLTDLQAMLNGFSERVEDNMKRVSSCARTPGGCSRT